MNLITNSELLGLGELPADAPAKKEVRQAMKAKTSQLSTKSVTGKALFEKMLPKLPADIQKAIRAGQLQLVDEIYYVRRAMAGISDKEIMEAADTKTVGITNVNNRKLEANKWSLLCAIQVLSGKGANVENTEYGIADKRILNGEFELEVGSTVIVPNISATVFDTKNRADVLAGYWADFDPQFITPNTEIKPRLKLAAPAEAETNVHLALHVVSVAKN